MLRQYVRFKVGPFLNEKSKMCHVVARFIFPFFRADFDRRVFLRTSCNLV